ncbi:hypothetical protein [Chondromyces crocatus]|nr:hypothetical protein [Chondromyces crocatus]
MVSPWRVREASWRRRKDVGVANLSPEEREAAGVLSSIVGAALLVSRAGEAGMASPLSAALDALDMAAGSLVARDVLEAGLSEWLEALEREGTRACLGQVGEVLAGHDARYEAFQVAAGVALVDGDLSRDEAAGLGQLATALGLSTGEAEQLFEGVNEWMG